MKRRRQNCKAVIATAHILMQEGRCSDVKSIFNEAPSCRKSAALRDDYRIVCGRSLAGKKRRRRTKRRSR